MGIILLAFMAFLGGIYQETLRYRLTVATVVPLGFLLLYIFGSGLWLFSFGFRFLIVLLPVWLLFWAFVFLSEIVAKRFNTSKLVYTGFATSLLLCLVVMFNFYNLPFVK